MSGRACECEHVAHTDRHLGELTPAGKVGHVYGAHHGGRIASVLTPWGTFRVCPACRLDCFGGYPIELHEGEALRAIVRADVLTTGELQPRLPGEAGAVRDLELTAGPVADLPFTLTAPTHDATDAAQPSLLPSGLPEVSR